MTTPIHAHPLRRRRPACLVARCAVAVLALGAVAASRLDPIPRVQPVLCAGSCNSLASITRGVA